MSQWPRTLSEFLGTNVQSYTHKKKEKAHVSEMSTCNLNSFVGTVNVQSHTHTLIHALTSLMIRSPGEEAEGNSPGGEGCKANDAQTCFHVDVGMRSW